MKYIFRIFTLIAITLFFGPSIFAQCEPDTAGCKDTGDPGEFCPRNLPDAVVNVAYEEVITVIAPGEAVVGAQTIIIKYIVVDSVLNLPGGIQYEANADKFYPDSTYCINISGTPTTEGVYPLAIYVTPFISAAGTTIPGPQVVNDTSVVMTVVGPSGLNPKHFNEFQVLPNIPNPFSDMTKIGFFTPFDDRVELKVYNILGELMHEERQGVPPGEYYFEFNGQTLQPGTYFYRVNNQKEVFTGKFIKARN
jgi:hypothetical protein